MLVTLKHCGCSNEAGGAQLWTVGAQAPTTRYKVTPLFSTVISVELFKISIDGGTVGIGGSLSVDIVLGDYIGAYVLHFIRVSIFLRNKGKITNANNNIINR